VLARIITRLPEHNSGTVPVVSRYGHHECAFGTTLPHLFERRPRALFGRGKAVVLAGRSREYRRAVASVRAIAAW